MASKKRIVSCAMASALALSTVGVFAGCDALMGDTTIWIAFAETGYGRAYLERWIEDFQEENPNYEFYLEGDAKLTESIGPRINTGSEVPDIVMCLDTSWQEWAVTGKLYPLDEIYQADADNRTSIAAFMNEGMRDYGKVYGQYYAIPWTDGATGLVYNYNMFKENNWAVPKTVDDLVALCDTIMNSPYNKDSDPNNNIYPFVWAGDTVSYWDFVVENWWAQYEGAEDFTAFFNFGAPMDEDGYYLFEGEEATLADYGSPLVYAQEGRVKALEAWQKLIVNPDTNFPKNTVPGAAGSGYTQAQLNFINGKAAMIPNGAWLENEMRQVISPGFEMRMMPTPFVNGAQTDAEGNPIPIIASQAGDFMCIPKAAPNLEGAIEFMKYINSREACESWTEVTGALRPFQYVDDLNLDELNISSFAKSCIEVYRDSTKVYHYSSNPVQWVNTFGKWAGIGSPYMEKMIAEHWSAAEVCTTCCEYVLENWWEGVNTAVM